MRIIKMVTIKNFVSAKTILLLLFSSFLFTNVVCKKDDVRPPIDSTQKTDNTKIPFKKQGEVYFQDKNKNLIQKIDAEIAETDDKRHLGLMFRDKLEENQGMFFIFQEEEPQGFYMRNTIIPLDIIFVNSKKQIVKIHKNTTPYSEKTLPSGKPAIYVVEVNGGFTDKYKIKEGDYIDWRRN
jgi:uncharacterized membrane protein (UPF0127 family)